MPFQKRRILAAAAAIGAAAGLALPSAASAALSTTNLTAPLGSGPCVLPPTSQVFSDFGDTNNYYLAGGGGFEQGLRGILGGSGHAAAWAGDGATSIVAENEPFRLAGARDRSSVRVADAGTLTSSAFCVSADQPHLRLLAKSVSGTGTLQVRVSTVGWTGGHRATTTVITARAHGEWAPTRFVTLNTAGMPADERGLANVTITSRGGTWLVDDVFIDPYAK